MSWVSVVVSSVVSIGVQAFLLCLFENLQVCPLGHSVIERFLSAMNLRFITAKRKLERLQFSTSSSFVKI